MTKTCAPAIAAISVAFPGKAFPDKTAELYGRMLGDLDPAAVSRAVERLLKGDDFVPTIHRIRTEVAEEALALPTPEEAWDMATRGRLRGAPREVADAVVSVGGRWALLHSDQPTIVRSQFMKSYGERRRNAIAEFTGAKLPQLTAHDGEVMGQTMAAPPETTSGAYLPVHARWLRRMQGQQLAEPTEAEKAHAIEVLRIGPPEHGEPDGIYGEAERILTGA
jgi:hypothetical protein